MPAAKLARVEASKTILTSLLSDMVKYLDGKNCYFYKLFVFFEVSCPSATIGSYTAGKRGSSKVANCAKAFLVPNQAHAKDCCSADKD